MERHPFFIIKTTFNPKRTSITFNIYKLRFPFNNTTTHFENPYKTNELIQPLIPITSCLVSIVPTLSGRDVQPNVYHGRTPETKKDNKIEHK